MALAAGFGLDFERCDPEILDAIEDILEERGREAQRANMEAELKAKMGR